MNDDTFDSGEAITATWEVFETGIVAADLTGPERQALYKDVIDLHVFEEVGTLKEAAALLKHRIGGDPNLRSYVNCLMAKESRVGELERRIKELHYLLRRK